MNVTDYHIFFITGNPGLISYYTTFLAHLSAILNTPSPSQSKLDQYLRGPLRSQSQNPPKFHVFGASLAGFETSSHLPHPLSLQEQIQYTESRLHEYVRLQRAKLQEDMDGSSSGPVKIILVGHSVGAYILLELLRRNSDHGMADRNAMSMVGGVLLFPTVTHIAKSPLGLSVGKILQLPHFALIISTLVHILTSLVPRLLLYALVRLITRFPKEAATTTVDLITSPMGVRQALHMARDEMTTITADRWDTDIWGASTAPPSQTHTAPAKLVFHFGRQDHWVANHTRDELIAARGYREDEGGEEAERNDWKPKMDIDDQEVPHGFCLERKHSLMVAEKVKGSVEEIVRARGGDG
ncbi:MAG: hypothetical protein M1827_000475 [Pycnora praestabilis]|nr:MAG: hypothetical protein M1827_000475 [Pycnora praestabilis]